MQNPLFPTGDNPSDYPSAKSNDFGVDPFAPQPSQSVPRNPAADLVRQKLDDLYYREPGARQEMDEAKAEPQRQRSKHQQFMYQLSTSGKSLADIQAAWHRYYQQLPEHEKHEVWQEFYAANKYVRQPTAQPSQPQASASADQLPPKPTAPASPQITKYYQPPEQASETPFVAPAWPSSPASATSAQEKSQPVISDHTPPEEPKAAEEKRSPKAIKDQLRGKISQNASTQQQQPQTRKKLGAKQHIQSLAFGLGFGALVLLFVLFSFFNQTIIAPFIQPSRTASATPIIIGADGVSPTKRPEVIIPKINVQIPLQFDVHSIDESKIENALEDGVVHYPTTVEPGQKGNTAFFGHSSNNIFNSGHYKFAFTLLHELVPGDTFYLTYHHRVYAYQVFKKKVVPPSNVSVLDKTWGKTATAALITCDPPGTSINRLVVWGEQVSPKPSHNSKPKPTPTKSGAKQTIAGDGPSPWQRFKNWF
jgi:LPXTG-site transpeptidase (sortase) family protein